MDFLKPRKNEALKVLNFCVVVKTYEIRKLIFSKRLWPLLSLPLFLWVVCHKNNF